jgi:hypothetical protein
MVQVGIPSRTRNQPVNRPRSNVPACERPSARRTKNSPHITAHVAQMTANTGSDPTDCTAWYAAIAETNALYQPNPCGSRPKTVRNPNHRYVMPNR